MPRHDNPEYTTVFCNRKTNFINSFFISVSLYVKIGLILGFFSALEAIFDSKNISYRQRTIISTVRWPLFLKILISPFIDSYFFNSIGKCKTYIFIGGLVNFLF